MINKEAVKFKDKLFLVGCGFFVFSPLSSVITMQLLFLPIALPELLLLPFLPRLSRMLDLKVNITNRVVILFCLFLALLAISIVNHEFRVSSILSTSRGYFYMLLAFSIFSGRNKTSINDILLICLGSVISWCLLSLIQLYTLSRNLVENESLGVYGNMVTLFLLVTIAIITKKNKILFLSLSLGLLLSITAGLRRQIIIFFLSIMLSYLFIFISKTKRTFIIYLILGFFILFSFYSYSKTKNFINAISPILQERIFLKSEQLVSGNLSEADYIRSYYIKQFLNNLNEYVLPKGFVSKRTTVDVGTGRFMDFPLLELAYMLGLIGLASFFLYYFYCVLRHSWLFIRARRNESAIWAISGILLTVLICIEGSFLNYASITPITGMVLAKITSFRSMS